MNTNARRMNRRFATVVAIGIATLVTGCASLNAGAPATATSAAASDDGKLSRAEQVFRYQSRIANDVFDRYPLFDALESADPAVKEAEARMTESCSTLAQAVLARFAGEPLSLGLRLRVMRSIDTCERTAREMDELLNSTAIAESI